jgi:DNA-binding response OmpR family regulator
MKNAGTPSNTFFVLEASTDWRKTFQSVALEVGFTDVSCAGSFEDLLDKLEAQAPTSTPTVMTSLHPSTAPALVCALGPNSKHPILRKVRNLILYSANYESFLPYLFENGVLASLSVPCSPNVLAGWLKAYKKEVLESIGSEDLFAGRFLGNVFARKNSSRDFVRLQKQLLMRHPGNVEVSIRYAEFECKGGRAGSARKLLLQAGLIHPQCQSELEKAAVELSLESLSWASAAASEGFDIQYMFVVDGDADLLAAVEKMFQKNGVHVRTFAEPADAFAAMEAGEVPQLIIFDWRLPRNGGTRFVQRVAAIHADSAVAPILLALSGFLRPNDGRLLQELGVVEIVPKPFAEDELVETVFRVLQRERCGMDAAAVLRRLRKALRSMDFEAAQVRIQAAVDEGSLARASAELLRAETELRAGKALDSVRRVTKALAETLADTEHRILGLHLLGCSLLKLGQADQALKVFAKTDELSAETLERMCLIAQCHAEKKDWEACSAKMNHAISIDPENPHVVETASELVARKDSGLAHDAFSSAFGASAPYVAQMNNVAVACSRLGQLDKASRMLANLLSLCGKSHAYSASLFFNTLVVLCRRGLKEDAKQEFETHIHEYVSVEAASAANWTKLKSYLGLPCDAQVFDENDKVHAVVPIPKKDIDSILADFICTPKDFRRGLRGVFLSCEDAATEIQKILEPSARGQKNKVAL